MDNSVFINSNDVSIFKKNHIEDADINVYSRHNLIIGENGSGKTRFLKALEKQRSNSANNTMVLTLYFPEISSTINEVTFNEEDCNDNTYFMFDVLRGNVDINFKDFLKVVENAKDRCVFIKEFYRLTKTYATEERNKAVKTIDNFNHMFKTLLNRQLRETNDQIIVDKYYDNNVIHSCSLQTAFLTEEMSPGELMMFYFILFLYYIEFTTDKKLILIIDEPEQHLHPQKQIYLIKELMNSERVSELWVATHSLFLIPLFDFEGLVLIDHSCILKRSSNTYKNAFNSLVGLENTNIFEFLKSINSWQYYQFILECFCFPKAKEKNDVNDEQFRKTIEMLDKKRNSNPLKVLDFGAGKCRIWDCLKLEYSDVAKRDALLEYIAYEPFLDNNFQYDSSIEIISNKEELTKYNNYFDVIILMNVLHEISVNEWKSTFQLVSKLLTNDGILVLLEVNYLANGEQPYGNNGFLVLNDEQIQVLFNTVGKAGINKKGKSNIWTIEKSQLESIDDHKIRLCIESLRDCTESKLREAFVDKLELSKNTDKNIKDIPARNYAFLSQQYINAKFALEILGDKNLNLNHLQNDCKLPPPPITKNK